MINSVPKLLTYNPKAHLLLQTISLQLFTEFIGVGDGDHLRAGRAIEVPDSNLHVVYLDITQHSHVNTGRLSPGAQGDLVHAVLALNLAQVKEESRLLAGLLLQGLLGEDYDVIGQAGAGLG